MERKSRNVWKWVFVITAVACVAVRIVWVNTHARIPENKIYARGESLVDKKGLYIQ